MDKAKGAERIFLVINEIILAKNGLSFTELYQATKLPKSSLHLLLKELTEINIINFNPKTKRYNIGTAFIRLGALCISRVNLVNEINELALKISTELNETVHAGILSNTDVIYIAKQESDSKISIVNNIGITIPAHCTGVGKALLMGKTDDELRGMYNGVELIKFTENTICDIESLIAEINIFKKQGFSTEKGESSPMAGCVAVPIYSNNAITASISATIPLIKMSDEYIKEVVEFIQKGVDDLEKRINLL